MITVNPVINDLNGQFVVSVDGKEAGYIKVSKHAEGVLNAYSTLVYDEFRTYKLGSYLYDALIKYATDNSLLIHPTCPYVVKLMKRDSNVHHLLTAEFKQDNGL